MKRKKKKRMRRKRKKEEKRLLGYTHIGAVSCTVNPAHSIDIRAQGLCWLLIEIYLVNTQDSSYSACDNKAMIKEIKMQPSREQKNKKNVFSTIDTARDQK